MASFSQVSISNFPANNQVIQRNDQDKAIFQVKGEITENGHSSITLKVLQDGNLFFEQTVNTSTDFSFSPILKAGKFDYSFILLLDGTREIKKTNQIGVGDLFLVYGQSNALGNGGENTYSPARSPLIRFFAVTNLGNGDGEWVLPYQTFIRPGTGASELLRFLTEKYNYPVGVIIASVGGATIADLNYRNEQNPTDTNTHYGKLLNQTIFSGSKESLKYIIFKQGESDSAPPQSKSYEVEFKKLYDNFCLDFPNLKRFYNLQIDIMTDPDYKAGIRDFQRRTPQIFPKITAMSTVGTTGFDGVHYSFEGYRQVAYELSRIIGKEVYGDFQSKEIYSPDIKHIYKADGKLVLEFDEGMQMVYPNDTLINNKIWRMKDYIFINGQNNLVVSGESNGNKIILKLIDGADPRNVSYLPNNYGTFGVDIYKGVHLKNKYGMRAFSFDNVKVEALPTPINLSFSITNDAKVILSWNLNESFQIERSTDNIIFSEIASVNGMNYTDNGSEIEQKYYYRLVANGSNRRISNTIEVSLKCLEYYELSFLSQIVNFIGVKSTILANVQIPPSKQLSLEANKSINLEPGFDAELGSVFSAEIGGCKNN
ncbi:MULTISPECIES: sialate O-acetylesterase [Emticicia]|uniref:sialate O-acetylesterase n=1 Tax=Emticicia TaxID=312278 RepID=UPI0007D8C3A4|nr:MULTISPECIES: sialate O-acetylesterase [Emticicia]